jgi:hypothetical protein
MREMMTTKQALKFWALVSIGIVGFWLAIWGKFVAETSDYQRLERLEERVTQLEGDQRQEGLAP